MYGNTLLRLFLLGSFEHLPEPKNPLLRVFDRQHTHDEIEQIRLVRLQNRIHFGHEERKIGPVRVLSTVGMTTDISQDTQAALSDLLLRVRKNAIPYATIRVGCQIEVK